mmetsp:Transcript_3889/g.13784  ORF Transcript_3889/g.13784 Transcript_3889/m.13784 type:complete len:292 (-) Transcript_3889:280-1155(-)
MREAVRCPARRVPFSTTALSWYARRKGLSAIEAWALDRVEKWLAMNSSMPRYFLLLHLSELWYSLRTRPSSSSPTMSAALGSYIAPQQERKACAGQLSRFTVGMMSSQGASSQPTGLRSSMPTSRQLSPSDKVASASTSSTSLRQPSPRSSLSSSALSGDSLRSSSAEGARWSSSPPAITGTKRMLPICLSCLEEKSSTRVLRYSSSGRAVARSAKSSSASSSMRETIMAGSGRAATPSAVRLKPSSLARSRTCSATAPPKGVASRKLLQGGCRRPSVPGRKCSSPPASCL